MSTKIVKDILVSGLELGPAGPDGSRRIISGTVTDKTAYDYSRNANALTILTNTRDALRTVRNTLLLNGPVVYAGPDPDVPAVGVRPNLIVPVNPIPAPIVGAVANIIGADAKNKDYHIGVIAAEKTAASPAYVPVYPVVDPANSLVKQLYSAINQSNTLNGIENLPPDQKDNALNEAFRKYLGGSGGAQPAATEYGSVRDNNGLIGKIVDIALALKNPNGKPGKSNVGYDIRHTIPNAKIAYDIAVAAIADLNAKIQDAVLRPLINTCRALSPADPAAVAALAALQAAIPLNPHASASVIAEANAEVTRLAPGGGGGVAIDLVPAQAIIGPIAPGNLAAAQAVLAALRAAIAAMPPAPNRAAAVLEEARLAALVVRGPFFVAALTAARDALVVAADVIYPPGMAVPVAAYADAAALRLATAPAGPAAAAAEVAARPMIAAMRANPLPAAAVQAAHLAGITALTQAADALRDADIIMRAGGLDQGASLGAGNGPNQTGADAAVAVQALIATAADHAPRDQPTAANLRVIAAACDALLGAAAAPPGGIEAFVGGRRNRSPPRKSRKLRENIRRRRNTRRSKH